MSAGLLYSLVTMPFETAKNAMAFQQPDATTGEGGSGMCVIMRIGIIRVVNGRGSVCLCVLEGGSICAY